MSSELSQAIVLTSGGSKTSIVRTIHPSIQHDTEEPTRYSRTGRLTSSTLTS